MRSEYWTIAYRNRTNNETLLENQDKPFRVIPNNWRYWAADPHLITAGGTTWLFAELYDRLLRRGVIGCRPLTAQRNGKWKIVLKQPYHLSYPHLLRTEDSIFMIPESYVADEIAVFHAEQFPDQWKKIAVLHTGGEPVDSTVFTHGSQTWMLSLLENRRLMLYSLSDQGAAEICTINGNDSNNRPAGNLFLRDGKLIRPAQDCTRSYGCALNFYEVTSVGVNGYSEQLVKKITPDQINSDLGRCADGIHTYNMNDEYEVIDLKGYELDILRYLTRPIWFVWRRVRKVFGK